jgi:hypothetical protein
MGVVNMYTAAKASLAVHVDPKLLFKRPIISAGGTHLSSCTFSAQLKPRCCIMFQHVTRH